MTCKGCGRYVLVEDEDELPEGVLCGICQKEKP